MLSKRGTREGPHLCPEPPAAPMEAWGQETWIAAPALRDELLQIPGFCFINYKM